VLSAGEMGSRTAGAKCMQNIKHVLSIAIAQAFEIKAMETSFKLSLLYSKKL